MRNYDMESFIVGAIIVVAAGYAGYRLFAKPSCGCGSDCACSGKKKTAEKGSDNGSCNCGK